MRTNTTTTFSARTHEGAVVPRLAPIDELRRSVLACLLFEKSFYEAGEDIADRIKRLAGAISLPRVLGLATEARFAFNLRHAPLWLLSAALEHPERKQFSSAIETYIAQCCKRPDDVTELLAMYWRNEKHPIAHALKRGLAEALKKFDRYQLAKYAARGPIRLRDVMFLTHAKPANKDQAEAWKALADDTLQPADTWEVALSAGADKRETFTRLLENRRLGGLAILRNLRNMHAAGVDRALVFREMERLAPKSGILPFQFIAAARAVPQWEHYLEPAMLAACADLPKLKGRTVIVVDTSGSMNDKLSSKSELRRIDAARALAIMAREICEDAMVLTYDYNVRTVPSRRGFALGDAISEPNGGTDTRAAVVVANSYKADRILVITDEQSHTAIPAPVGRGYVMNVASYQNGIAWGPWTSITGFSENVLRYIAETEG